MLKKVLILDLDNTIYPVAPYGDKMFASFLQMIEDSGEQAENIEGIKKEIMRRSFLLIARMFNFSKELTERSNEFFKQLRYHGPIQPFDDFKIVRDMNMDKFLVTAGYTQFQQDKIDLLSLHKDFKEIHIIDATKTSMTKRDAFADIIDRHRYMLSDVLAIGDDLESEIKAAGELGIDAVLYDKQGFNTNSKYSPRITHYSELASLLSE